MATSKAASTPIGVLVFRALSFPNPEKDRIGEGKDGKQERKPSENPSDWFHLQPRNLPQEIPAWVRETDTYRQAVAAHYLIEVVLPQASAGIRPPEMVGTANTVGNMQQEYFPPLAAESRPITKAELGVR